MAGEVSDTFNENGRTNPLMIFSSLFNVFSNKKKQ